MKKIYNTAFALLVLVGVTAISCSDDDSNSTYNSTPTGSYIKGKVDGAQFESVIMGQSTAIATRTGSGDQTLISVQGTTLDTNTLLVTTMGITQTGTYTVDAQDDGTLMAYFSAASNVSYDTSDCGGATGTLNITHLDASKIEGTFNFVGKDDENCSNSKTVTEGSFRGVFVN
jgi:hypothetical protein